ncbi:augmin complex subunit dgt3 [Maniola hyperantus]|uniref:augmin complex subunit dgt3 n=1 Tax=Aphantopus hyperantus TaxID=2795564 RepID=UPI001568A532|nr:augmin complex subunit dgt3 [Maniola hyperantus]
MNEHNHISDEEFIPFLRSLGVETYNKSFEWLLSDPDYAGVLGWIYDNLDQNNALTAREECRYSELEKQGKVLSPEDLQVSLHHVQNEFKGLCLPGDQDGLEDVRLDISIQKQRLEMLNKQEDILKELIQENQATNQELTMELSKLYAAEQQEVEDEASHGEECVKLAQHVEVLTSDIVDTVAGALNVYGSCAGDKEASKRFFTYGPFDSYQQTKELFKSHVDMFTMLKFDSKLNDGLDNEARLAVLEARNMEDRLSGAIAAYIESKADLSGELEKLALITNYSGGHSSPYTTQASHKCAIQLLEQEESILGQQIHNAIQRFVDRRTSLTVDSIAKSTLLVREQIYKDLTFLKDITNEAAAVDRLLYNALQHELYSTQELLCFASHLRMYLLQETDSVSERIKSMDNICMEQDQAENNLQNSDVVLESLFSILNAEPVSDPLLPIKLYNDIRRNIQQANDEILYGYRIKEAAIEEIKDQAKPLHKFVWDGCTKRPNCHNRSVSSLRHALTHETAGVDARVLQISESFNTVKNGDKNNLRKLWQWFLTDPTKLLAAIRHVRN